MNEMSGAIVHSDIQRKARHGVQMTTLILVARDNLPLSSADTGEVVE